MPLIYQKIKFPHARLIFDQNPSTNNTQVSEEPEKPANSPTEFANRVEKLSQKEGLIDQVKQVKDKMVGGVDKAIDMVDKASTFQKAAILIGGAGLAYLGYKAVQKISGAVKEAISGVSSNGEAAEKALDESKNSTIGNILSFLGLGSGIAIMYEAVKGKIGLAEIMQVYNEKGIKGIAWLIVEKIKDGVVDISEDLMSAISGILGFAGLSKLKDSIEEHKGALAAITAALGGFAGYKLVKKFGLNLANPLKIPGKSLKLLLKAGAIGGTIYGLVELYRYLSGDKDSEKQAPPEEIAQKKAWWKEKLAAAGVEGENDNILALISGEKDVKDLFQDELPLDLQKDQNGDQDSAAMAQEYSVENHPKYGEMIPLSEKTKDQVAYLEENLIYPMGRYVMDHPYLIGATVLIASQIDILRKSFVSGVKFSASTAFAIAKLPLRAVNNYPISTILGVTALLYSLNAAGNLRVPKDNSKMADFLSDIVNEKSDELAAEGLYFLPQDLDLAAEFISGQRKIEELAINAQEIVGSVFLSGVEALSQNEFEYISQTNTYGLDVFIRDLNHLADQEAKPEKYKELISKVATIKAYAHNKQLLPPGLFEEMVKLAAGCAVDIIEEDGIFSWVKVGEDGIAQIGPKNLMVSHRIGLDEQYAKAQNFYVEPTVSQGLERVSENSIHHLRMLGSNVEEILTSTENWMMKGARLAIMGPNMVLIGSATKIVLGPIKFWSEAIKQFTNWELNATDLIIEYGNSLLPVVALEIARFTLRGEWMSVSGAKLGASRILFRSATYPFTGVTTMGKFARDMVWPLIKGDTATVRHRLKNNRYTSDFFAAWNRVQSWKYNFELVNDSLDKTLLPGFKQYSAEMYSLRTKLNNHYQALTVLYEGKDSLVKTNIKSYCDRADEILGNSQLGIEPDNINASIDTLEKQVAGFQTEIETMNVKHLKLVELNAMKRAEALIVQAQAEANPRKKEKLFKKAEDILVEEKLTGPDLRNIAGQTALKDRITKHETEISELKNGNNFALDVDPGISARSSADNILEVESLDQKLAAEKAKYEMDRKTLIKDGIIKNRSKIRDLDLQFAEKIRDMFEMKTKIVAHLSQTDPASLANNPHITVDAHIADQMVRAGHIPQNINLPKSPGRWKGAAAAVALIALTVGVGYLKSTEVPIDEQAIDAQIKELEEKIKQSSAVAATGK